MPDNFHAINTSIKGDTEGGAQSTPPPGLMTALKGWSD